MKKSGASQAQSPSELISKRIAELRDWRGVTLSRMRTLIKQGFSQGDIARELGVTRQAVQKMLSV